MVRYCCCIISEVPGTVCRMQQVRLLVLQYVQYQYTPEVPDLHSTILVVDVTV